MITMDATRRKRRPKEQLKTRKAEKKGGGEGRSAERSRDVEVRLVATAAVAWHRTGMCSAGQGWCRTRIANDFHNIRVHLYFHTNDFGLRVEACDPAHEASDATEAIDTHWNLRVRRHFELAAVMD